MPQLIDCTMLCTHTVRRWTGPWAKGLVDGKLRIRVVDVADDAGTASVGATLDAIRVHLQDSHLCLLPVCPDNVSWVRMLLGQASRFLPLPIMAVTSGLKAVALRDLLALGVADFIPELGCHDELRVRVERVLAQTRIAQLDTLSRTLGTAPHLPQVRAVEGKSSRPYGAHADGSAEDAAVTDDTRNKVRCGGAVRTYTMGRLVSHTSAKVPELARFIHRQGLPTPQRDAVLRRSPVPYHGLELEAFAAATATRCALQDEPFKQAKGRVVDGFEKAYLTATLRRYSGNIAQAARAAKKHRRAFWELVRKHHIDLSQYRASGQVQPESRST